MKRRRLLSTAVIVIVVAVCAVIIFTDDAPLLSRTADSISVTTVSDDSGGAIVAWQEDSSLFVQHIDSSGQLTWDNRVLISNRTERFNYSMITDGSGGAIFAWEEHTKELHARGSEPTALYCRRVTADGQLIWSEKPVSEGRRLVITPDGSGGAILAWDAHKMFTDAMFDSFLTIQNISSSGEKLWGDEGKMIIASSPYHYTTEEEAASGIQASITRTRPSYNGSHYITGDGEGNIYIGWFEKTPPSEHRVCLQLLDKNGSAAWPENIAVADASLDSMVSDPTGIKITTYISSEIVNDIEPYDSSVITHIDSEGTITEYEGDKLNTTTISDGAGGTFKIDLGTVTISPFNGEPVSGRKNPMITRLDASGKILWEDKKAVPDDGKRHVVIHYQPDGSGGIITIWDDWLQHSVVRDIRARKLDASGTMVWDEDGVPVFDIPGTGYQNLTSALSDENGGIIIFGIFGKSALPGTMIYAQRLDSDGNRLWKGGVRINP